MTVILASTAPVLPTYEAWIDARGRFLRQEYEWSGLADAFDRRSVESIYPSSEFEALEEAVVTRRCLQIAYESHGETVQGFLVVPSSPGGVWPAIVYARGGNRDFGSIGIDTLLDFLTLADAGYVVIATQYRGGPGSGGNDEFGGRDVDDLLNLVPLLESRADVDPGSIFALGVSRGGMMTMLAARRGFVPRAVALRAPMLDLNESARLRDDMRGIFGELMPDYPRDPEAALTRRSALAWAAELPDVPMLLLHGDSDPRVPVTQSVRMHEALRELGRSVELHVYEEDAHLLLLNRSDYLNRIRGWFDRHRTR
jgi:dipeptidyl aminopeptidase/acylaminoacyl peptidase